MPMPQTVEEAKKELQRKADEAEAKAKAEREKSLPEAERIALKAKEETEKKSKEETAKKAQEQEAQDKDILAKKEEERNDAEKARAKELADAESKKKEEEEKKLPADEKIERFKESTQKRIDEIKGELKDTKHKSEQEIAALKDRLAKAEKDKLDLEQKLNPPKDADIIWKEADKEANEEIAKRKQKYLDEDKSKPREERKEMSKEELQAWLDEDYPAATDWITGRRMRQEREYGELLQRKAREKFTIRLWQKQQPSFERLVKKHSELNTEAREKELKAEGKTLSEIQSILCKENEIYRIFAEITNARPDLMMQENGPELVGEELEKRLAQPKANEPSEREKALEDRIKKLEEDIADKKAREELDEGVSSTVTRKNTGDQQLTQREEQMLSLMKKHGASQEDMDEALKKDRAKKK